MTIEEVLQKVNDYCTEKQYTSATLTDAFKNTFVEHFVKANPEGDINDEAIIASLKFNINTAFKSASDLATAKQAEFLSKENDYKNQIAELNKKIGGQQQQQQQQQQEFKIPKEVQEQLDELKKFKSDELKKDKLKNILKIAKTSIREDQHKSFDTFAEDFVVDIDKDDKEQGEKLAAKFKAIMKDSIGDITPLAPRQTAQVEKELLESVEKIEL